MPEVDYTLIENEIRGAYLIIEGGDKPKFYVDQDSAYYHVYVDLVDDNGLIDGKNWWILEPCKPKGVTIGKENQNLIKWFVMESSIEIDEQHEWDFGENKVCEDYYILVDEQKLLKTFEK